MNVMCMIGNMALIGAEKTGHLLGNAKYALKGNLCSGKVMNDFTKEELMGLKNIVLQSREDYPAMHADKELTIVLDKIQSMIDNYCEHQNKSRSYGYEPIDRCDDCGLIKEYSR